MLPTALWALKAFLPLSVAKACSAYQGDGGDSAFSAISPSALISKTKKFFVSQKDGRIQPTPCSPGFSPGGAGVLILPSLKGLKINLVWQQWKSKKRKEEKKKKKDVQTVEQQRFFEMIQNETEKKKRVSLWSFYRLLICDGLASSSLIWRSCSSAEHCTSEKAKCGCPHPCRMALEGLCEEVLLM